MSSAALVTGASSGIGRDLAMLLAQDRQDLILVARNQKRLDDLALELTAAFGISVRVMAKDLSDAGTPATIFEELSAAGVQVHTLVNNAGLGVYGPFAVSDTEKDLEIIRVNVAAVTHLSRLFLPAMIERGRGQILNVASTAAFQPGPLMAVYYATKAYVLSFSEAIANELAGSGVTVTALCPGPTKTEFQTRAGLEQTRLFTSTLVMDSSTVARAGYEGMKRGRRIVIPGFANKVMVQSLRLSPRRGVTAVVRRMQEKRRSK